MSGDDTQVHACVSTCKPGGGPEADDEPHGRRRPGRGPDGLAFSYGSGQVLHGISFAVRPGEVVGLLGRNGAGKGREEVPEDRLQARIDRFLKQFGLADGRVASQKVDEPLSDLQVNAGIMVRDLSAALVDERRAAPYSSRRGIPWLVVGVASDARGGRWARRRATGSTCPTRSGSRARGRSR